MIISMIYDLCFVKAKSLLCRFQKYLVFNNKLEKRMVFLSVFWLVLISVSSSHYYYLNEQKETKCFNSIIF